MAKSRVKFKPFDPKESNGLIVATAPWQNYISKFNRRDEFIHTIDFDNPCGCPCLECTINKKDCIVDDRDKIGKFRKVPNGHKTSLHNREGRERK